MVTFLRSCLARPVGAAVLAVVPLAAAGCVTATPQAEIPPLRVLAVVEPDGRTTSDLTGLTPPEVARVQPPRIPDGTPMHHLPAVVVLRATVTPAGDAEDIEVVDGATSDLDAAAAESLARWRFRPAIRGDRPVPVLAEFRIGFEVR